jgi:hypothetical protein
MSVAGCGFPRPPDLVGTDGAVGPVDDGSAVLCLGSFVTICVAQPTQPLVISEPTTLDTTASPLCAPVVSGGDHCVIAATEITIFRKLRATGARPLVLFASGTIMTGDTVDVGSHRGAVPEIGAGADPARCDAGASPEVSGVSAGGGAGGSFIGVGGGGGAGGAARGGVAGASTAELTDLRGGCAGQDGSLVEDPGLKGHGGGAVYFLAGSSIALHGAVNAGGEGGGGAGGGPSGGGGGGGGAGGMIGFEAPSITVTGTLVANGGGGGEGVSPFSSGTTAHPGEDAISTFAALGGDLGDDAGGRGGNGAAGLVAGPGQPGATGMTAIDGDAGGGGGGGGAGVIQAPPSANLGTSVSPPRTP